MRFRVGSMVDGGAEGGGGVGEEVEVEVRGGGGGKGWAGVLESGRRVR